MKITITPDWFAMRALIFFLSISPFCLHVISSTTVLVPVLCSQECKKNRSGGVERAPLTVVSTCLSSYTVVMQCKCYISNCKLFVVIHEASCNTANLGSTFPDEFLGDGARSTRESYSKPQDNLYYLWWSLLLM